LWLDSELRDYLEQAIEDADRRIKSGLSECASYMTSVKALLKAGAPNELPSGRFSQVS
jgi:hypothetical protein